jgi:predicted DNA-binding transcriptional regulator YafY
LLKVLYSRSRIVSVSELADVLETNPRNIPEYVEELRNCGYEIKTVHGRYGGYLLERNGTFPALKLSDSEREGLMSGYEYLLARNDFMEKADYGKAMGKITAAIMSRDTMADNTLIANRFPLAMPQEELEGRYLAIQQCIANKTVLEIEYLSLDNEVSKRAIHPYKLYMYNNAWFVLGFDENKGDIRYFKINRIDKYTVQTRKFRVLLTYNESDYLDEYGMKQNGEWYPIKLKLTGNYSMLVKERIYGKDQKIEEVDEKSTILSCKMQNKDNVLKFVLGFGADCEVLEPEWLKDKVVEALDKTKKRYEL